MSVTGTIKTIDGWDHPDMTNAKMVTAIQGVLPEAKAETITREWRRAKQQAGGGKAVAGLDEKNKELGLRIQQLEDHNYQLTTALAKMKKRTERNIHDYQSEPIRFGLVSDTHLGSLFANTDLLDFAYDYFAEEGITQVYHSGDILAGEHMYRGQEYELAYIGADTQILNCIEHYPRREGIITHFITGNHDHSYWKRAGISVGEKIEAQRSDMIYLGMDEADVILESGGNSIVLRLFHPAKGTAYAISYQIQKFIESLSGGHKPNIACIGHYHKTEYLFYRNIHAFQSGCVEHQTPFMRGRNIAAMMGFWIIEVVINSTGIISCKGEFFPCYD